MAKKLFKKSYKYAFLKRRGFKSVFKNGHWRAILGRLRFTFTSNGKREFVPRDQVFFLIVVYCLLLLLKNKYFHASFIHKNCSGQFLFSYFLFWEILNLNPTLAVCRKRES